MPHLVDARTVSRVRRGDVVEALSRANTLGLATGVPTCIIVARSGNVVASGKRTFYRQIEQPLAGGYAVASETMACDMLEPDAAEGIDAFFQKRPARWPAG